MTDRPQPDEVGADDLLQTPPSDTVPQGSGLVADAKRLLASHEYAQVIELLENVPEGYCRSSESGQLLQQARILKEEADRLFAQVRQAVRDQQYAGLRPVVERLLELEPSNVVAREVLDKLVTYSPSEPQGPAPTGRAAPAVSPSGRPQVVSAGYGRWFGAALVLALLGGGLWLGVGLVQEELKPGRVVPKVQVPKRGKGEIELDRKVVVEQPATTGKPTAEKPSGPAPPPAIAPFDALQAREHQAAWAKYLGVPVEFENSIGMKMVLIPPGEFQMGSTEAEKARLFEDARTKSMPGWYFSQLPWETPQHRVTITKPFYLGRCEVAQSEYVRVEPRNPSHFQVDPTRPVEQVTWEEAAAFCRKLSERPQEAAVQARYRLPSEAEWEYACRAGTTTTWYATDDETAVQQQAWTHDNCGGAPHPVGQKTPNAWGLYDMHGNLWEWCQDWMGDRYYATSPVDDPTGPSDGSSFEYPAKAYRGGSWWDGAVRCRAAYRGALTPVHRENDFGFRVAMSIPLAASGAASPPPRDARASPGPSPAPDRRMPKPTEPAASQPSDPVPPPASAPFDATQAKEHQAAWAKHLGVPVELENWNGMRFVLIPPGEFDMGLTEAEVARLVEEAKAKNLPTTWYSDRLPAAAPKHRVKISQPFYLGRCEVTQAEYVRLEYGNNLSHFKGDPNRPAESVSWDEASAFCRNLGYRPQEQAVQAQYRLPTEAEWEYACRAGTTTAWYCGDDQAALKEHAWFRANAEGTTHPVGQKAPNAWGLYDMHGNVWEWCQDGFAADYYRQSPAVDPTGPPQGSFRVHRGGSWFDLAEYGRGAYRSWYSANGRNSYLGFRVARSVSLKDRGSSESAPTAK